MKGRTYVRQSRFFTLTIDINYVCLPGGARRPLFPHSLPFRSCDRGWRRTAEPIRCNFIKPDKKEEDEEVAEEEEEEEEEKKEEEGEQEGE